MQAVKIRNRTEKPEGFRLMETDTNIGGYIVLPETIFEIEDAHERYRATWLYLRAEFTDEGIVRLFGDDRFLDTLDEGISGDTIEASIDIDEEMTGL